MKPSMVRWARSDYGGVLAIGRGTVVATLELTVGLPEYWHVGLCATSSLNYGRVDLGLLILTVGFVVRWNVVPRWNEAEPAGAAPAVRGEDSR